MVRRIAISLGLFQRLSTQLISILHQQEDDMYGGVPDHGVQRCLHPQQLRGQLVPVECHRGCPSQGSDSSLDIRSGSSTKKQENTIKS